MILNITIVALIIVVVIGVEFLFGSKITAIFDQKKSDKKIFQVNNYKEGEKLINVLMELDANLSLGVPSPETFELPRYKFYHQWTEMVLSSVKKLGIAPQKFLRDIIGAIKEDLKFEAKVKESLVGGIAQSVTIIIVTWIFIYLCYLNELKVDYFYCIVIAISHGLGIVFFIFLYNMIKEKRLKDYQLVVPSVYFYKSFIDIGLAISEIVQRSGIEAIFKLEAVEFKFVILRLKAVNNNLHRGLSVKNDLGELIQDVLVLRETKFGKVSKELNIVKFVLLIIFYLIPYFLYLYGITSSMF